MLAKDENKQIEMYCWDLVWKLVKAKYEGDFPTPSDIWNNKHKVDKRSAKQILEDLVNGLGGE